MTRQLRVHPSAETEVDEAAAFYDERRPGVGHDFVVAAGVAMRSVLSRIGSPVSVGGSSVEVRRVRVRPFDYEVVYAVLEDYVFVLAVAHTERRPLCWTDRVAEEGCALGSSAGLMFMLLKHPPRPRSVDPAAGGVPSIGAPKP